MIHFEGWLRPNKCGNSNCCVEIRRGEDGMMRLRSSLSPYGVAVMKESEFRDFVEAAKAGEYDHLYEDPVEFIPCSSCPGMARLTADKTYQCGACLSKQEQEILKEGYHGL